MGNRPSLLITPASATLPCWEVRCLTPGCELAGVPEVGDEVAVSLTATVHAQRRGHRVELAKLWEEEER